MAEFSVVCCRSCLAELSSARQVQVPSKACPGSQNCLFSQFHRRWIGWSWATADRIRTRVPTSVWKKHGNNEPSRALSSHGTCCDKIWSYLGLLVLPLREQARLHQALCPRKQKARKCFHIWNWSDQNPDTPRRCRIWKEGWNPRFGDTTSKSQNINYNQLYKL